MRAANLSLSLTLLVIPCTGCHHRSASQQAQAPPLQTGGGTLHSPATQQQVSSDTPLASPLPPPSAQAVPLPPPPPPKKVRRRLKQPKTKPADTTQTPAAGGTASQSVAASALPQQPSTAHESDSPIGQLTTGDSAMAEKTRHETVALINETQQGLNAIKRALSTEEKITAAQIHTFLNQAQQALDNGDPDGAHTLATKARLLLDEVTKP
jgi:hypothetical protein